MTTQPGPAEVLLPSEVVSALGRGVANILRAPEQMRSAAAEFEARHRRPLLGFLAGSDSTVRAYTHDWVLWASWCAEENHQPLPARAIDVAVFLAACAHSTMTVTDPQTGQQDSRPRYAIKTIERRRDAIAAVHRAHGHRSPTGDPLVLRTLEVIRRTHARRRRGHQALVFDHIDQIMNQLPPPGWPGGLRRRYDRLVLLMGYVGGLSGSEIAARSIDDVDAHRDPDTGATLLLVCLGTSTDASGVYEEAAVLARGERRSVCPVCAFVEWVEVLEVHSAGDHDEVRRFLEAEIGGAEADSGHVCGDYTGTALADGTGRPLFPTSYRGTHVGDKPITGQTVNNIVKRYVEVIGLDPDQFGGQSLRAGSSTAVALGGSLERNTLGQGGWTMRTAGNRVTRLVNSNQDNAGANLGR